MTFLSQERSKMLIHFSLGRILTPVASVICSRLGLALREALQPGATEGDTEECKFRSGLFERSLLVCRRAFLRTPNRSNRFRGRQDKLYNPHLIDTKGLSHCCAVESDLEPWVYLAFIGCTTRLSLNGHPICISDSLSTRGTVGPASAPAV
jgi:hypothetical protein